MNMEVVQIGKKELTFEDYSGYGAIGEFRADLQDFKKGIICGAPNSSNKMCKNPPIAENGRCRHHGGKSVSGVDHYNFKGGLYSTYVPKKLLERYQVAMNNPDLISLNEEIGLVRARISELVENIGEAGSKESFNDLHRAFVDWQNTSPESKSYNMRKTAFFNKMEAMSKDINTWDEVYQATNTLKRLVQQQHKKMEFNNQYVEVKKVVTLMSRLLTVAKREIEALDGMLMDEDLIKQTVQKIANKVQSAAQEE